MKLVFSGDCVIQTKSQLQVSREVEEFIKSHDYGVCNFEGPIKVESAKPIIKAGPHVCNSSEAPSLLRKEGF